MDKHRKLLVCGVDRGEVAFTGSGFLGMMAFFEGPFHDGDPVARWDARGLELNISLDVTLAEVPDIGRPPAVQLLRSFSGMTRAIIETFR
ncbi:MAG: hypothetical protein TEF_00290 [Rhizobiales bacterium NRL2]|nr:MAG: hypothetical protein TEF_00290 [Rhizobiales bacterium NRL2]